MEKYRINPISGEIVPINGNSAAFGGGYLGNEGEISGRARNVLGDFIPADMKNSIDFEVGAETTKPIAERGRSDSARTAKNIPYSNSHEVKLDPKDTPNRNNGYKTGTQNKRDPLAYANETLKTVHPGDPNGGENIPPTAPSRQTVPKVPNRAWTEMSVGGNFNENSENDSENEREDNETSENSDEKSSRKDRTVTTKAGDKLIKTIVIAGQIEGHSQLPQGQKATRYEELIPQLVEIEEDDEIGGLLLILNTVGGDVEAGLALSELIAGMKKPTASLVLGGGHSIGVPLAVSAKRSFIVPSATMTLHPVRITGMILGAPQTYVYMSRMQSRIVDFTCSHCKMSPQRFNELMLSRDEMSTDLGSVLDGGQAVREGLIDSLGALGDAIEYLRTTSATK